MIMNIAEAIQAEAEDRKTKKEYGNI